MRTGPSCPSPPTLTRPCNVQMPALLQTTLDRITLIKTLLKAQLQFDTIVAHTQFMTAIAIAILLFVQWSAAQFSPLRLLDKQIEIVQQDGAFELVMPFKNGTNFNTLVCFASTDIRVGKFSGSDDLYGCELSFQQPYNCLRIYGRGGSGTSFQNLQKRINIESLNTTGFLKTNKLPKSTVFQQGAGAQSMSDITTMQLFSYEIRINLSPFLSNNSIFHMVSCDDYTNGDCNNYWKLNYVHTFVNAEYASNLIVQRNHACGVYFDGDKKILNHVFYGGTRRDKVDIMFFAILVQHEDEDSSMNMWGGLGYTNDHTNKDMFCFSNANGQSFDALSLLLGAPYKDIAANIEGEESTSVIGKSFSGLQPFSSFYFIQYYRAYDTGDFIGDDRLFLKIDDTFAYAAYFDNSRRSAVSCTNKKYKHQLLFPIKIDLTLFTFSMAASLLTLVLALMLAL